MIKEFWQERAEQKRKEKELRKQNRKLPKTKEQRAYKVFGLLFALFLIFGSIFYACSGFGDIDNYSWDKLIGITDEIKVSLSTEIKKSDLITNKELNDTDWQVCKEILITKGLGNLIVEDSIDLSNKITLNYVNTGALASHLLELGSNGADIDLVELIIYQDGIQPMLKTLMYVDLSATVISSTLPYVFMTSVSRLEILDNKLYCLDTTIKINNLDEEKNAEVLEVLEKNAWLGLECYTNDLIVSHLNDFAEYIHAKCEIKGIDIQIIPKLD